MPHCPLDFAGIIAIDKQHRCREVFVIKRIDNGTCLRNHDPSMIQDILFNDNAGVKDPRLLLGHRQYVCDNGRTLSITDSIVPPLLLYLRPFFLFVRQPFLDHFEHIPFINAPLFALYAEVACTRNPVSHEHESNQTQHTGK